MNPLIVAGIIFLVLYFIFGVIDFHLPKEKRAVNEKFAKPRFNFNKSRPKFNNRKICGQSTFNPFEKAGEEEIAHLHYVQNAKIIMIV